MSAERRVACIAHFLEPEDALHWDPSLRPLGPAAIDTLLRRAQLVVSPFVTETSTVRSADGTEVEVVFIGIPYTTGQIAGAVRDGDADHVVGQIEEAVAMARDLGCSVVGLTGHTSIATDGCRALVESRVGLTSGNSLTAAAALMATRAAAEDLGIALARASLGVVGAVGNIGAVLAEVAADAVASVTLVGRPGAERRLAKVAHRIGDRTAVDVATDMASLRGCDLIISASNAARPIVLPGHIAEGPAVVCDVAAPADVDPAVARERPRARVIRGGRLELPGGQTLTVAGMPIARGHAYACVAETILLGMAGMTEHFSYGPLQPDRVRRIARLAELHGFRVAAEDVAPD